MSGKVGQLGLRIAARAVLWQVGSGTPVERSFDLGL